MRGAICSHGRLIFDGSVIASFLVGYTRISPSRLPLAPTASFEAAAPKIRAIRAIRDTQSWMKHEKLTGEILGAAMAVLNEFKPGLDEKLYENALVLELAARGLTAEQQRQCPVYYRGHFIGKLVT